MDPRIRIRTKMSQIRNTCYKNEQRNILTINIFNKTAVSCEDSLDPGPEARAGLRQGVPAEGPHHLLHLLDQIVGFVAKL